jgi:5-methylcytosine-specific restriction protein B
MDYFDFSEHSLSSYRDVVNKPYKADSTQSKWFYDVRSKLYNLITLLKNDLKIDFKIIYREKPNGQAGRSKIVFKNYILAGFSDRVDLGDHLFLKVEVSNFDDKPRFAINIDLNFRAKQSPFAKQRDDIFNNSYKYWLIDDQFPKTWERLVGLIKPEIENLYKQFNSYLTANDLGNKTLHNMDTTKPYNYKNQILYGPPGTGKTYHTINKAISIINPSFDLKQSRDSVKAEYKRLVDSGQIVFTTFHQSLSYEDFVEGIKPLIDEDADGNKQVIYDVQPGILKQIVDRMVASSTDTSEESSYTFDDGWNELIELSNEQIEAGKEYKLNILTPKMGMFVTEITSNGNLKLRPSKGSGKEYLVSYARSKKLQQAFPNLSVVKNIDKEFRAVIGGMNSTAYWSVLNFINNKIASKGNKTNKSTSSEALPHVLIIDEINRGNVSAIFGELITLIEESKREGKEESLEVTLPYSKEKFIVPENLYIIGTMNTADRSVEAIDTALRRRFVFEEMLPNYQLPEIQQQVFGCSAAEILKKINDRIEKLIDRDHCIGHAYFIGKDKITIVESFYKNIIPLLQEYFFGDYGKIGLVLGKGFVEKKTIESNLFADFEYDYKSELEERPVYEIIDYRLNPTDRGTFQEAIGVLMSNG